MLGANPGQVRPSQRNCDNDHSDAAFPCQGGIWIFNMDSGNLTAGNTYRFRINLATGPGITFHIRHQVTTADSSPHRGLSREEILPAFLASLGPPAAIYRFSGGALQR